MPHGNGDAAFRVTLLTFHHGYLIRTVRPMIQTWREIEFVRSRTRLTPFHIRLRPKAVWYDTPTFHATIVSIAFHIGLILMLAAGAINLRVDAPVRANPLFDGGVEVVFLAPKDVRRIIRESTPTVPTASESKPDTPSKPEPARAVETKPKRSVQTKSKPKTKSERVTLPKPTRTPVRSVPPAPVVSRQVARRDSDFPNTLAQTAPLATSARLPASEASFLSALPVELPNAFASAPFTGTDSVKEGLPEPVYRTPESADTASSDAGGSDDDIASNDGTPTGNKLPQPDSVAGVSLRDLGDDESPAEQRIRR